MNRSDLHRHSPLRRPRPSPERRWPPPAWLRGALAGVVTFLSLTAPSHGSEPSPATAAETKLARELEYCESGHDIDCAYAGRMRVNRLRAADGTLSLDIDYAHIQATNNRRYAGDRLRIAGWLIGGNTLIGLWLCFMFWRQKGVTVLERAICIAVFLAITAEGLWEAFSTHATNLAAVAEAERASIEAAERTAADSRLEARWQYDRQIAAAELVLEQRKRDAEAAAALEGAAGAGGP